MAPAISTGVAPAPGGCPTTGIWETVVETGVVRVVGDLTAGTAHGVTTTVGEMVPVDGTCHGATVVGEVTTGGPMAGATVHGVATTHHGEAGAIIEAGVPHRCGMDMAHAS